MRLINCSPNGLGTIWLPDDATDEDIWLACYLDATEESGNGSEKVNKRKRRSEKEK